jgi:hypothetical protein
MKIEILSENRYAPASADIPEAGRRYYLEDEAEGSENQNRAFHALTAEYWRSGCASYPSKGFDDFRNHIKKNLGAGFEAYVYATIEAGRPVIRDAKTWEDIPAEVRRDPDLKRLVRGRLKSWADYTKKERTATIDNLIREMIEAGVNSAKFGEIIAGMEAGE